MMRVSDASNRNCYMLFHLDSGITLSSRDINFQDVELSKVKKIEMFFKYNAYALDKTLLPSSFLEFVHFRSGGQQYVVWGNGSDGEMRQIMTWTLGWTDGTNEYLDEFEFKTGKHLRRYVTPRNSKVNPSHFHKQSRSRLAA